MTLSYLRNNDKTYAHVWRSWNFKKSIFDPFVVKFVHQELRAQQADFQKRTSHHSGDAGRGITASWAQPWMTSHQTLQRLLQRHPPCTWASCPTVALSYFQDADFISSFISSHHSQQSVMSLTWPALQKPPSLSLLRFSLPTSALSSDTPSSACLAPLHLAGGPFPMESPSRALSTPQFQLHLHLPSYLFSIIFLH